MEVVPVPASPVSIGPVFLMGITLLVMHVHVLLIDVMQSCIDEYVCVILLITFYFYVLQDFCRRLKDLSPSKRKEMRIAVDPVTGRSKVNCFIDDMDVFYNVGQLLRFVSGHGHTRA